MGTCKECNGTGERYIDKFVVAFLSSYLEKDLQFPDKVTCKTCQGTGVTSESINLPNDS